MILVSVPMAKKKRKGFLQVWLILMIIFNSISALSYFLGGKEMVTLLPSLSLTLVYAFGFLAILNIVFVVYLFRWKKWPLYAVCGNAVIIFILNVFFAGMDIGSSLVGLLSPIILYLAMRPQWDSFE